MNIIDEGRFRSVGQPPTSPDNPRVRAVEDAAGCHFYAYLYRQWQETGESWYGDAVRFIADRPVRMRKWSELWT